MLAVNPDVKIADTIILSFEGDDQAMSVLFSFSGYGLDGAGADDYASWLGQVLRMAGDIHFGEQLSREPDTVQKQVRDFLCYDLGVPDHLSETELHQRYPITFPQPVLGKADAWSIVRSSRSYLDALARVEDASAVRLTLERRCEEGYLFWVWEDMQTHAVTLERILINPSGMVYVLNSAEAQWVRED